MLSDALDSTKAQVKQAAPTEIFDVFAAEQARNTASGVAAVGSIVADFKLQDATGGQVSLDEIVANGPAVLVFYRGSWCPYCNTTLHTYQQGLVPELEKLGVRLVAISPQLPDGSLSMKEANELEFSVLSDVGNEVARPLGITYRQMQDVQDAAAVFGTDLKVINGTGEAELPHPTVLIVNQDKTIRFIDVHPDYTTRTEPEEIVAELR
ncbi:peroxiredoxin-like family protein [Amycolatopsis sp.]|jgi:peroxiredoxin|uniref:peroxiredoxin-like family protein n=1 Tax=Amycolatopsis sp. TaxID=37632 RepID=UPI002DFE933B|nr:peroxiredoxin-like family protein [Amycolatopsis sp.]